MKLKKKEYQRQKTNSFWVSVRGLQKCDKGQIGLSIGMFFILYLAVLLASLLLLEQLRFASLYTEDALAASNLASAVIDLKEYGTTHIVRLNDPQEAYNRFHIALRGNLNLDEQMNGNARYLIADQVRCLHFILYNVEGNNIQIIEVGEDASVKKELGALGQVRAPNGQYVEHTGIYSEITFPIKGLFDSRWEVRKSKLVDIVGE